MATKKETKVIKGPVQKVVEKVVEKVKAATKPEPVEPPAPVIENKVSEPVVTVTEPPFERDIGEIAAEAWDAVKGDGDASFADCQPEFRTSLLAHAEAVRATGKVMDGDTNLARFEQKVLEVITAGG